MSPTFTEEDLDAMQAVAWGEWIGTRPHLWLTLMRLNQRHPELVEERAHIAHAQPQMMEERTHVAPYPHPASLAWGWALTEAGRALLEDLGRLPPNPNDGRPRPVA